MDLFSLGRKIGRNGSQLGQPASAAGAAGLTHANCHTCLLNPLRSDLAVRRQALLTFRVIVLLKNLLLAWLGGHPRGDVYKVPAGHRHLCRGGRWQSGSGGVPPANFLG